MEVRLIPGSVNKNLPITELQIPPVYDLLNAFEFTGDNANILILHYRSHSKIQLSEVREILLASGRVMAMNVTNSRY
jgi:hypothetical protein